MFSRTFKELSNLQARASLVVVIVFVLSVLGCKQSSKEQRDREFARVERLLQMGYRLQPDGTLRMGTRVQLWREGTVCDHRYLVMAGRTEGEVYAMNGEKQVFGMLDRERRGDRAREIKGEWVGRGQIRASDIDSNEFDLTVISELEKAPRRW